MKKLRPSERVALLFRAFSDPTRLRILHLVGEAPLRVADLVAVLRVPQPTASRHLGVLRRAGLVRARRAGRESVYGLAPAKTAFHRTSSTASAAASPTFRPWRPTRAARRACGINPLERI